MKNYVATMMFAGFAGVIIAGDMADYRVIFERNAFSLKPPGPAPLVTPGPAGPRSKITITGITTIFGDKRVLLKKSPPPANPGEPARLEESYILSEGQTANELQIVRVEELAGVVTVKNGDVLEVLKLELPQTGPARLGPPPPAAVLPVPLGTFAYRD